MAIGMNNVSLNQQTWCGLTVVSSVTGIAVEELNQIALEKGAYCRKKNVKGLLTPTSMYAGDVKFMLEYHNYTCEWKRDARKAYGNRGKMRLADWFIQNADKGSDLYDETIVFLVTGHFIVLHKGKVIDTVSDGKPVAAEKCYSWRKQIVFYAIVKKSAKRLIKHSEIRTASKVVVNREVKVRDYTKNPKRETFRSHYQLTSPKDTKRILRFSSFTKAYDYLIRYEYDEEELSFDMAKSVRKARMVSARAFCKEFKSISFYDNDKTVVAIIEPIN
jgi:hypothetical protein